MKSKKMILIIGVILTLAVIISVTVILSTGGKDNMDNTFKIDFEGKSSMTELTSADKTYKYIPRNRVSVHDPSIVEGYIDEKSYTGKEKVYGEQNEDNSRMKVYFIFGTLRNCAYSTDLQNWTSFTNNINKDFEKLFENECKWAAAGDSSYNLASRIWAPDVIWNPYYINDDGTLGSWLMYVSIDGVLFNSSVALLTTPTLNGDWTYKGTVLYSGFTEKGTNHDYTQTDYLKYGELDGDGTLPDRYVMGEYTTSAANEPTTWNKNYGGHAIDPAIFFDEEGQMKLVYGSFAGGIYILDIDKTTGFRTDRRYDADADRSDGKVSDPYCGVKLAGGNNKTIEGSYIKYLNGKYYLFVSVGGMFTYTGYNMRIFSSENAEGEYKDFTGNSALDAGIAEGIVGSRLMFYYKWDWMDNAQMGQGHNSVYKEGDNVYAVYHSKANDGNESFYTKVHQLFITDDGCVVAAPFEYSSTDLVRTDYKTEDIVGEYKIVIQKTTDYANMKFNETKNVMLNSDGTVSGEWTGTWKYETGTSDIVITDKSGVEFKGALVNQKMEITDIDTLCFTVIGQNMEKCPIWGFKLPDDSDCVSLMMSEMPDVKQLLGSRKNLPAEGNYGTKIMWFCDSDIISKDGKVKKADEETTVKLTAVVMKGDYYYIRDYSEVVVK